MAYFYQDGPMHGHNLPDGRYHPAAPIERILCDQCAESGLVPFTTDRHGLKYQARPWRWAPWLIGGDGCDNCGAEKVTLPEGIR